MRTFANFNRKWFVAISAEVLILLIGFVVAMCHRQGVFLLGNAYI